MERALRRIQDGRKAKKYAGSFESLEKCRMLGGLEKCRKVGGLRRLQVMQERSKAKINAGWW